MNVQYVPKTGGIMTNLAPNKENFYFEILNIVLYLLKYSMLK